MRDKVIPFMYKSMHVILFKSIQMHGYVILRPLIAC